MRCLDCGTEMRDLLTSTYCPNDCDRTSAEPWTTDDPHVANFDHLIRRFYSLGPAASRRVPRIRIVYDGGTVD